MSEKEYNTFINRPFVSKDGNGSEVQVQRGSAVIESVDKKKSKDTVKFLFSSDNLQKHGVGGWINAKNDSKLYDILMEAYDEEEIIYFRVEKQRKSHVDLETPIKDLIQTTEDARDNTITVVASARLSEDDEWTESSESVTHIDNDRSGERTKAKPEPNRIQKKQSTPWNGTRSEPPPYVTRDDDGDVNPGSNAVAAVTNIYQFVHNYVNNADNALEATDNHVIMLTRKLLTVVNKAQVLVYNGELEQPDMGAASHTRARSLVFHAAETTNKITQAEVDDEDALNEWAKETLTRVVKMWKWSISMVEKIEGD